MIRLLQSLLAWLVFMALVAAGTHIAAVLYLPQFLMGRAMERIAAENGINAPVHAPPASADARTIVRPSPDLLYSACAFNLAQANLRIAARAPQEGYWSLSMIDAGTNTFYVRNNVEGGTGPVDILLVGPGGAGQGAGEAVAAPTFKGVVLVRRLIADRAGLDRLEAERQEIVCEPAAR